jgi:hypothetical protein
VVLRVVSLLEVRRLTLVPHLPPGDQTPAHIFSVTQSLIVVPVRLLSISTIKRPLSSLHTVNWISGITWTLPLRAQDPRKCSSSTVLSSRINKRRSVHTKTRMLRQATHLREPGRHVGVFLTRTKEEHAALECCTPSSRVTCGQNSS